MERDFIKELDWLKEWIAEYRIPEIYDYEVQMDTFKSVGLLIYDTTFRMSFKQFKERKQCNIYLNSLQSRS